tara:strand:+ start:173 stop:1123 length:951 start_codon:yes stop_codon:yes gene_type:complete
MNNKNVLIHVWLPPLLFVIVCLSLNYLAGSLDLAYVVDERSQRDFNAALGMPLIIGYLWLAIRIMHRRAGRRIADFLVSVRRVDEYPQHIKKLEKKLITQVVIASALAISITMIYLTTEGLLALGLKPAIILLNAIAVPFWFFLFLFIMQSASFTRYMYRHLVLPSITRETNFSHCKALCDLGLSNVSLALMMLMLVPIFWLGKPIPVIDLLILMVMVVFMLALLFLPVLKTLWLMRTYRAKNIASIETAIEAILVKRRSGLNNERTAVQLNQLNQQLEDMRQFSCWPRDIVQNIKIFLVSAGVPATWLLMAWFVK